MGSIRGVKKRKKSDNNTKDAIATTPFPLYSQLHHPSDWWYHFSKRITGMYTIFFLFF